MAPAHLVAALLSLTAPRDSGAEVRFSATIRSDQALAITTHDLGGGVLAHIADYRGQDDDGAPAARSTEILAYSGDRVDFTASSLGLVATRSGADLRPVPGHLARWRADGVP